VSCSAELRARHSVVKISLHFWYCERFCVPSANPVLNLVFYNYCIFSFSPINGSFHAKSTHFRLKSDLTDSDFDEIWFVDLLSRKINYSHIFWIFRPTQSKFPFGEFWAKWSDPFWSNAIWTVLVKKSTILGINFFRDNKSTHQISLSVTFGCFPIPSSGNQSQSRRVTVLILRGITQMYYVLYMVET